jgi:Mg/Co/Ni transporter MgtE
MLCRRIGIDPAIVAGPFLITMSDVSGAAIFVGITQLVLHLG